MAELKVRGLSAQNLAGIDAANNRAHSSREVYLREYIHHDATDHLLRGDVLDLRELTKRTAIIIEQNTKTYLEFVGTVRELGLSNEN
ncbi:hypothetical protein [Lacticaseibacillus paracasei]|uniref:hypothetical protein n=1 Tax=Lacticaseibacillus paracasei TaxID=1597 RepID=UPI0021A703AC|nr:hypothetical protein [Lacticaseibacillus paracasei]MCT2893815.1 hypothetical protein [Lacticaseibacillus paracasei]MEA0974577.1 hypothetical protein [Lacticaseibacillus paracasei]